MGRYFLIGKNYADAADFFALAGSNFALTQAYNDAADVYVQAGNAAKKMGDCERANEYWSKAKNYYSLIGINYNIPPCENPVLLIHGLNPPIIRKPVDIYWKNLISALDATGIKHHEFDYGTGLERILRAMPKIFKNG